MPILIQRRRPRSLRRKLAVKISVLTVMAVTSSGTSPSSVINAMPPHPDLVDRIQRGEVAPPPALIYRSENLARGIDRAGNSFHVATAASDSFRTLAILIRYSDVAAQANPTNFDTLLYVTGTSSVRDYYSEISYGKLDMVTVDLPSSTGWQVAPETKIYYANGKNGLGFYPQNAQKLVEDAVDAADSLVDFSRYDNDGDGRVDALMIIHTGPGAEFTGDPNDIWSHKWSISPRLCDGVYVRHYTMMPEYWTTPGDITIGVFAHELGHVFGLPDLYDRDYSSRGLGRWSLMAGGSWNGSLGSSPAHVDAWCRMQLGFVTPTTVSTQALGTTIPQIETDSVIYQLWDGGTIGDEYFLVENRQQTGFDAALPGSGLMIWHIDEAITTQNDMEWYPGYTDSSHYLVALEPADGLWNLEQRQGSGDAGDPFPGTSDNRSFTSSTTPNSLSYDGAVSLVSITDISNSGPTMTADLSVSLALDVDDDVRPRSAMIVKNYPNPFNAQTKIYGTVTSPTRVTVTIYNVLGAKVRELKTPNVVTSDWEVSWDGLAGDGSPASSGVYWYQVAGVGVKSVGKMVMLK